MKVDDDEFLKMFRDAGITREDTTDYFFHKYPSGREPVETELVERLIKEILEWKNSVPKPFIASNSLARSISAICSMS